MSATKTRYLVMVLGVVVSTHRRLSAAERSAQRITREAGLVDDGAYCGDDGWPSIICDELYDEDSTDLGG